jgi:hypothetical protein
MFDIPPLPKPADVCAEQREQAVMSYKADLRAKVEALRDRPIATFDGYTGLVALDQVLALIDGAGR